MNSAIYQPDCGGLTRETHSSPLVHCRMFPLRLDWILVILSVLASLVHAEPYATNESYRAAIGMDFRRAAEAAHEANEKQATAESRFALALALLNEQPKTRSNLDKARLLFESIHTEHTDEELGAGALYFLARIEHAHSTPLNPRRAEGLYRQLFESHPKSDYGERAFLFYSILRQHAAAPLSVKRTEMMALDTDAEQRLRSPVIQRLYHFAAGLAWSRVLQDDERALAHHRRVYVLGLESDFEFANLLLRIAELERRRGDANAALRFYREFLQRAPADRRSGLVADWVRTLEQGGSR